MMLNFTSGRRSIYLREIVLYGGISAMAIEQLEAAVATHPADASARRDQQVKIAAGVQQVLYSAAMVSKFLWPISKSDWASARAAGLRDCLSVGDDNPLNSRAVRDSIEHYDERLDAFAAKDYNTFVFSHWMVASEATFGVLGTDNSSPLMRGIDPDTLVVRLLGRDKDTPEYTGGQANLIDLRAQDAALQDICRIAQKVLEEPAE
ncbi:hypothetical protein RE9425_03430 [Prescottella equi]|nr:hypothetical protein RE9425_03430 [Prescottella equi]